jgi:hypothetical protein
MRYVMVEIIAAEVDVILHRSQKIPACHSIAWLDACLQRHAEAHLEGCGELPIFKACLCTLHAAPPEPHQHDTNEYGKDGLSFEQQWKRWPCCCCQGGKSANAVQPAHVPSSD